MRVLLISHTCQSPTEGQPKVRCLADRPDLDLRVLVPHRWRHYGRWRPAKVDPDLAGHIQVGRVVLPWTGPGQVYLHGYPGLAKLLREFQPDVIDLWEEPWGLVSAQACWLRNRLLPNARIVSETEQNINKKLPFPFERFRTYTLRNADFVVGRNAEAIEHVRGKGYRGPAEVVPNAVDVDLFRPLDRQACRRRWRLSGEAFIVGYVGRLVPEKGLADLIAALPHGPPAMQVLCVGAGPFESAMRRQAAALGVADRLIILPGQAPEKVAELMNAMDLLALPSRTTRRWKEQFGRVIIEAHACRVPVIGSDSGAIPEVIDEGGIVVPEADPAAIARAVTQLAADPVRCGRLARLGRRQVQTRCTWQRVADRMHAIYQKTARCDFPVPHDPAPAASRR